MKIERIHTNQHLLFLSDPVVLKKIILLYNKKNKETSLPKIRREISFFIYSYSLSKLKTFLVRETKSEIKEEIWKFIYCIVKLKLFHYTSPLKKIYKEIHLTKKSNSKVRIKNFLINLIEKTFEKIEYIKHNIIEEFVLSISKKQKDFYLSDPTYKNFAYKKLKNYIRKGSNFLFKVKELL
jgi:hypothetical protein